MLYNSKKSFISVVESLNEFIKFSYNFFSLIVFSAKALLFQNLGF